MNLWDMSGPELIASFVFTWGLGLSLPILVRVVAMEPLSKAWAVYICGVWYCILVVIAAVLGGRSKTHAALVLATFVGYYILRKGSSEKPIIQSYDLGHCPSCNELADLTKSECASCGYKFNICPTCDELADYAKSQCSYCGYDFTSNEVEIIDLVPDLGISTAKFQENSNIDTTVLTQKPPVELNRGQNKFLYKAELERRIYAHILKEQEDAATMLQAEVLCDGDTEEAKTAYYKLKYNQIAESGLVEEFKRQILKEKDGEFAAEEISEFAGKSPDSLEEVSAFLSSHSKYLFLLGAILLHVLFCAESPLLFISKTYPLKSLLSSFGYSILGMMLSIIIVAPFARVLTKETRGEGFFEGFTLRVVNIALYVGAAIRFLIFISR